MVLNLLSSTILAVFCSAVPSYGQDSVTAFINVSVVPMDRERVLAHQTVLVQGDHITAVGPVDSVRVPPNAVRVDGRGKFLMPGLADMHVHIGRDAYTPASDSVAERILFMYVANGVTTIRNMSGYPELLALRRRVENGELLSPLIYTAGPPLNEFSPLEEIAQQKAAGYDFLKFYPMNFPVPADSNVLDSFMTAARRIGLRVAGHVPRGVGFERVLKAGYASIEHLDGYIQYVKRSTGDSDKNAMNDGFSKTTFSGLELDLPSPLDESKISVIAEATKRAGVWNCPTLGVFENMVADTNALVRRPEMRYVSDSTLEYWLNLRRSPPELDVDSVVGWQNAVKRRLVKALHDAGAGLLLGTDGMPFFTMPGFSIHQELALLVAAGLTPYQAIETGTRNPAIFFGALNRTGTVATGKRADLILLSGNPLADIQHTAHPAGVMIGGRWLPREEIDAKLATMLKGV